MIGERSVVPRVAKPFGSSLLESYWPEAEHLSNGLGSAVSFKIPMFGYVADLNELFTLARGWVIAASVAKQAGFLSDFSDDLACYPAMSGAEQPSSES